MFGTDDHALRFGCQKRHRRHDLQHLHRLGQPVMREPERLEAGIARDSHLLNKRRDLRRHIHLFRILRVDEQPDLHSGDLL